MARLGLVANVLVDLPPVLHITHLDGRVEEMAVSCFVRRLKWCDDLGFVVEGVPEIFSAKRAIEFCYAWSMVEAHVRVVRRPKPIATLLMVTKEENEYSLVFRLASGAVLQSNSITWSVPSELVIGCFPDVAWDFAFITPEAADPQIIGRDTDLDRWIG
jgi:hypothetical protein